MIEPGSARGGTQRVWTSAELAGASPEQDQAILDLAALQDVEPISADFLARVRSGLLDQAAAPDARTAD